MSATHIAYISAGSNLGNKLKNCCQGIQSLTGQNTWLKAQSLIYKTEPVDYTDQDWFINLVVKIGTILDPMQLLHRVESIQRDAGRVHDSIRFGPRILDLDIIFYDDAIINSAQLIVPHPRMHKRRFVLQPLCDIDPTIIHPVLEKDVQSLLEDLDDNEQRIIVYR
ncbi:MAG: 2-amino-4-hydroxy-6-hydroxymethyldihydropteridine diphosphokinase [Desulfobacterales bacterium]|nr:MAG: 2-amino-4-hydroxy-6-hydroxymethyldihydropteridine diphosphokinase [Desulfobacterales bacterium]